MVIYIDAINSPCYTSVNGAITSWFIVFVKPRYEASFERKRVSFLLKLGSVAWI